MKFAYPEFLYALFAIAIPIIIHLFNFRKFKKVYFSNVQFLKDIKQETQSKSKLKHLLILLSRILAIAFLVLAFAQPFIPSSENSNNQRGVTALHIDNSFSMESVGEKGSLINEAKTKAIAIINAYPSTDKFIVSTNNFNAGDQHLLSNEEAINKIEAIEVATATRNLSAIYSRNKEALHAAEIKNKSLYVLSDFQQSTSDFKNLNTDSSITSYLAKLNGAEANNIYIDSCWFSAPTHLQNETEELNVRIKNSGNTALENIPVKLYLNNTNVVPASFSVEANSEVVLQLKYRNKTKGTQLGRIELRDNPITMDNIFYFAYQVAEEISVLNINERDEPSPLQTIYEADSLFKFQTFNVNQLDYSLIKKSNLVIINELNLVSSGLANAINDFTNNGGHLFIIPSNQIDFASYQEFLSLLNINYFTEKDTSENSIKAINYSHPLFRNVFEGKPKNNINLPKVFSHYNISKSTTAFKSPLLSLKNGAPFLNEYKVNNGTIYLSSVSLSKEASNFSNHAIFVPTIYNIALLSQKQYPLFHTIGSNSTLSLNRMASKTVFHIKNDLIDFIPRTRNTENQTTVFVNAGITAAGNYTLVSEQNKVGLAYNYNRSESKLTYFSPEQITEFIHTQQLNAELINTYSDEVKTVIGELNIGKKYWKYCIILVLLFLATEIALIKIYK